jgi:hypothetical protein
LFSLLNVVTAFVPGNYLPYSGSILPVAARSELAREAAMVLTLLLDWKRAVAETAATESERSDGPSVEDSGAPDATLSAGDPSSSRAPERPLARPHIIVSNVFRRLLSSLPPHLPRWALREQEEGQQDYLQLWMPHQLQDLSRRFCPMGLEVEEGVDGCQSEEDVAAAACIVGLGPRRMIPPKKSHFCNKCKRKTIIAYLWCLLSPRWQATKDEKNHLMQRFVVR